MNYFGIDIGARNIFISARSKIREEGLISERFIHKMVQNAYDKSCSLYNNLFIVNFRNFLNIKNNSITFGTEINAGV